MVRFIKLSSPKLNNVAVIGCMLVYVTVGMMGLDDGILTDDAFPVVCSVSFLVVVVCVDIFVPVAVIICWNDNTSELKST